MAGTDIVYFYTDENTGEAYYGVRDLYEAWVAAGRPPINSAGRLYAVQKAARDAYLNGTGSPADDPDRPGSYELAHVRHAALDIDPTPARVAALSAAGLVRPFSYEPWHWRLQNIYNYPLVYAIPASAADGSTAFPTASPAAALEEETMRFIDGPNLIVWPNGVLCSYDPQVYTVIKQYVHYPTHPIWGGGAETFQRELWKAFDWARDSYATVISSAVAAAVQAADADDNVPAIVAGVLAGIPQSPPQAVQVVDTGKLSKELATAVDAVLADDFAKLGAVTPGKS